MNDRDEADPAAHEPGEFEAASEHAQPGLLRELMYFLVHHAAWWLTPIVLVLLLVGALLLLGGSAAAPFIYPLF